MASGAGGVDLQIEGAGERRCETLRVGGVERAADAQLRE